MQKKWFPFLFIYPVINAPAGDPVRLALKLTKGQSFTQEITITQNIIQNMQGMEQKVEQVLSFTTQNEVVDVTPDEAVTVKMTYTRTRMKQTTPMGSVDFDSNSSDPVPETAVGFNAMVGLGFSMKMAPDNRILDVTGADTMFDEMMRKMSLPDGPMKEQMITAMKRQFGDEALLEMVQGVTVPFPDKPIATGDTWAKETRVSAGFPMIMQNDYALVSRKDGIAILSLASVVSPLDGEPIDMGGMKVKTAMSGTQNGTIAIEEKTGLAKKVQINQKFMGTMTIVGMGMEIPMSMDSVVEVVTN